MTDLQRQRCPRNIILQGHVLDKLRAIPDESIDCVVTSPPFWRLRTYAGQQNVLWDRREQAWHGALGLEPTPYLYVRHILQIFREVRRVLNPHGTVWLVLGDTYWRHDAPQFLGQTSSRASNSKEVKPPCEKVLKEGDLVGIPWMVALALRANGWYLRNDIVHEKTNGQPESVRCRLTRSHEYVFLLSKLRRHYFDAYSISEPCAELKGSKASNSTSRKRHCSHRNKRSVWRLANEPFRYEMCRACGCVYDVTAYRRLPKVENERRRCSCGAMEWLSHSATMPLKLAQFCIMAGCTQWVCMKCGKPRERLVRRETVDMGKRFADRTADEVHASRTSGLRYKQKRVHMIPMGWSNCGCGVGFRRAIVLDPFVGTGTVAIAARSLRRDWLGIELSEEYIKLANERLQRSQTDVQATAIAQDWVLGPSSVQTKSPCS